MSRYDHYRNRQHGYHRPRRGRRYRHRRRDTAGTFLIILFVLMALYSLGRQPDAPGQHAAGVGAGNLLHDRQQESPRELEVSAPPFTVPGPPLSEAAEPGKPEAPVLAAGGPTGTRAEGEAEIPAGCDSPDCRGEFATFGDAPTAKAFALSPAGHGTWAAGEESVSVAVRKALKGCHESSGQQCQVMVVLGTKP